MQKLIIPTVLIASLLSTTKTLGQTTIFKEPISTRLLTDPSTVSQVTAENTDLQTFVESIYVNGSKLYNHALPTLKKGEFHVLLKTRNQTNEQKLVYTYELKDISMERIEEIAYHKAATYSALYGTFAGTFGLVILTLKE